MHADDTFGKPHIPKPRDKRGEVRLYLFAPDERVVRNPGPIALRRRLAGYDRLVRQIEVPADNAGEETPEDGEEKSDEENSDDDTLIPESHKREVSKEQMYEKINET